MRRKIITLIVLGLVLFACLLACGYFGAKALRRTRLRRAAMIKASHSMEEDGCYVHLAMSDGEGEIIRLSLLCAGEEQAKKIEQNFRKGAEGYYHRVIELLSE